MWTFTVVEHNSNDFKGRSETTWPIYVWSTKEEVIKTIVDDINRLGLRLEAEDGELSYDELSVLSVHDDNMEFYYDEYSDSTFYIYEMKLKG